MGMEQNAPKIRKGIEMEIRADKGESYNKKQGDVENGSRRGRQARQIMRILNNDTRRINRRGEAKREEIGVMSSHR